MSSSQRLQCRYGKVHYRIERACFQSFIHHSRRIPAGQRLKQNPNRRGRRQMNLRNRFLHLVEGMDLLRDPIRRRGLGTGQEFQSM
jgi:hypothetical protein